MNMQEIYDKLSIKCYATSDINEFLEYVNTMRENWEGFWKYATSPHLLKINFGKFIYSKKGIAELSRRIITKIKDENKVHKYHKNEEVSSEALRKPIIIYFGSGNGNMTISNTQGSSAKGPIKQLAKELSKYVTVIIVPEHNTSKLCNICHDELEDVKTFNYPSMKKLDKKYKIDKQEINKKCKTEKERQTNMITAQKRLLNEIEKIELVKKFRTRIHKLKRERKKDEANTIEVEELEDEVRHFECYGVRCYKTSYRLRRCANKHEETNQCKLFERNKNASLNMIKLSESWLTGGTYGDFRKSNREY